MLVKGTPEKMADILQIAIQMRFLNDKVLNFVSNATKICSRVTNSQ